MSSRIVGWVAAALALAGSGQPGVAISKEQVRRHKNGRYPLPSSGSSTVGVDAAFVQSAVDPSARHSQVTPAVRRVIYFPGRLPDEKKGNMFGRSTPSPEQAPDGPLNLNGSIKSADTAAATLLHHHPADTGTADRNGKAPDSTPAHDLDPSLTSPPPDHLEVEHVASELGANRNGTPERKESE